MGEDGLLTIEDIPTNITTKSVKNGTMTIYEVETYKGVTVSTTIREIAEQAYALRNQPAIMTVKMVDNGKYKNRYLQSIVAHTPTGAAMAQAQTAHAAHVPEDQPDWATTPAKREEGLPTPSQARSLQDDRDKQRDLSIHRQTAAKVAAALGGTADEFWENVGALVTFFQTGKRPDRAVAQTTPSFIQTGYVQTPSTSTTTATTQFIPSNLPQEEYTHTDDDIPF